MSFTFTAIETNVPRHSVDFIASQAKAVIDDRSRGNVRMCVNALPKGSSTLYTTKQASEIIERIVDDSLFHNVRFS